MNNEITAEQALNSLLVSSRQNKLTYDEHGYLDKCAIVLAQLIEQYKLLITTPKTPSN